MFIYSKYLGVESSWNVMAHGDARERKWRENWRMEWLPSTLHTTSELGVSGITTADAYTSAASSRLKWRPCLSKWNRPFRRKTKFGFCSCAITFQKQSTSSSQSITEYEIFTLLNKHNHTIVLKIYEKTLTPITS